jgi:hypothetical protein
LPHFGPALLELQVRACRLRAAVRRSAVTTGSQADPAATVRRFLADKLEEVRRGRAAAQHRSLLTPARPCAQIAAGCQQLLPACIAAAALLLRVRASAAEMRWQGNLSRASCVQGEHGGVVKRALLSAVGLFRLALARVCALVRWHAARRAPRCLSLTRSAPGQRR